MIELEHRIRERAHQLWAENGSPENMSEHFWLLAERQLVEEDQSARQPAEDSQPGQLEEDVTGRESGEVEKSEQKQSPGRKPLSK